MSASRVRRFLLSSAILLPATLNLGAQTYATQTSRAGTATAQSALAQADLRASTRLSGHLPVWANSALDAGPADNSTMLHLDFVLERAPAVQAAFDQLLLDQQTPGNARYHQWLTAQQIGQVYGPAQADLDVLTAWLTAQGFHLDEVTPSRTFVRVSAPVATAAQALSTSFRLFNVSGAVGVAATPHLSAASEPAIPTAFTALVQGIAGLSDIPDQPMNRMGVVNGTAGPQASSAQPVAHPSLTTSSGNHYLAPGDFAIIYDVPSQATTATDGTGQKVAIIGRSQVLAADVTNFQAVVGLPAKLPHVIIPPGTADPGLTYTGDQTEATLDVQRVAGSAPGAQIDLIVATNASGGLRAAIQYNVQTVMDPVMNISFGACEANAGLSNVNLYANLFSQAAAEGISVFVSSADSGVATCDAQFAQAPATQFASINYICSSAHTTCVGATEFNDTASPSTYWNSTNNANRTSALSYIPEGAWNEPTLTSNGVTSYVVTAGGGGVSIYTAKPYYQAGTGVPADGFRDVPDVSFSGAGHDGYFGCYAGSTGTGGSCVASASGSFPFVYFSGTSAAAPGMAAVTALLNQQSEGSQGNLNPLIYKLAANSANGVFHDATIASSGVTNCSAAIPSMCNNSTPSPTALTGGQPGYVLTTGFDLATGWGSLDIGKFLTAAVGVNAPTKTTLSGSQGNIPANTSLTFTATVAAVQAAITVPTGTVQFYVNGTAFGSTLAISAGGTATLTAANNLPVGTNLVTAAYSGDGTFAASTALPLTLTVVIGTGVTNTALTVTPTPAQTTQSLTFTAAVITQSGTAPTGSVAFYYGTSLLSTVPVFKGTATLKGYYFSVGTYNFTASYLGDGANAVSTSPMVSEAVTIGSSSTTLTGATSVLAGANVSVTVMVTASIFASAANVTLYDGTAALGNLSLNKAGGVVSQTLNLSLGTLAQGTHSLTAVYAGDAFALGSTSPALVVVVGSPIGITPAAASLTFAAGSATGNTDVLTLTSLGVFSGPVALTCSVAYTGSGASTATPSCSLSNPSVTLAAGGTATTTLALTTTAPHGLERTVLAAWSGRTPGGLVAAALLVGLLPLAGRRSRRRWNWLLVLLAGILLAGATGCGGGGPAPLSGGTTTGSYTITINAAGTLSGAPISATSTIGLAIQ